MATKTSHGHATDTTSRQRQLATRAREACETVLETVLRPTSFEVRNPPNPDGSFVRTEDRSCRKTWVRQHSEERVQLASAGPAATWQLEHQTSDGRTRIVESGLEREAAYARAEQYMADLDSVAEYNRTGRAGSE